VSANLVDRLMASRFLRFGIVGAGGFVVDTGVLFVLFQLFQLPYIAARAISILAAMNFTWMGNRVLTFHAHAARESRAIAAEWLRFVLTNAIGAAINWLVSILLRYEAPSPLNNPYLALVAGVAAGLVFNFTLSKRLVFVGPSPGE
jgi:putative flippase GtrA